MKGKFDLSSFEGLEDFYLYLCGVLSVEVKGLQRGSIKITVRCRTLEILEGLWEDYCTGHLNAVAEECFITEKVKDELGMETIKLATTILEDDYLACRLTLTVISGKFYCFQLLELFNYRVFFHRIGALMNEQIQTAMYVDSKYHVGLSLNMG